MKINIDPKILKKLRHYIGKEDIKYCKNKKSGIFKKVKRIIAIGDIHADFEALLIALYKSKCIDLKGRWIGGKTVVVQTGDILDRGGRGAGIDSKNENEELYIIRYLEELHRMALKKGGAVYSLLGNHELMNILGDFRYTTENTSKGFGGNLHTRKQLLQPGGRIAKKIACHTYGIVKIGNWIFVHGGILPKHLNSFSIKEINKLVKDIIFGTKKINQLTQKEHNLILGGEGIFWNRILTSQEPNCDLINQTINILRLSKTGGIVVGHTYQPNINSVCNKRLWKIDTGMSEAFGKRENNNRIQTLEILDDGKICNIIV